MGDIGLLKRCGWNPGVWKFGQIRFQIEDIGHIFWGMFWWPPTRANNFFYLNLISCASISSIWISGSKGPLEIHHWGKTQKKPEVFYTFASDWTFNCKMHGVALRIATWNLGLAVRGGSTWSLRLLKTSQITANPVSSRVKTCFKSNRRYCQSLQTNLAQIAI